MAEKDEETGFLARWSRRKRMAATDVAEDLAKAETAEATCGIDNALAEVDDDLARELEENRKAAEAVDIDSLTYEDDFKLFMKQGVPDALRKRALRKLWRSNPVLANLDGLNDYDDDFADPADNVYTSIWKVGRGFLSEAEQKAQHEGGRISAAYETDDEAGSDEASREAGDDETEAEPEITDEPAIADAMPGEAVPMAGDADQPEPVEEAEARPRVSIRRRLEG